jgi:hypothetical protein
VLLTTTTPESPRLDCLPACLPASLRSPLVHIIGCVFPIRNTDQWIDLPPSQLPPPIATSSPTYQPQQ